MPKKEGAKEKAANKAQAEADARAKAAEDAMWADDDRGKAKKDGKKVRAVSMLTLIAKMHDRMFCVVSTGFQYRIEFHYKFIQMFCCIDPRSNTPKILPLIEIMWQLILPS